MHEYLIIGICRSCLKLLFDTDEHHYNAVGRGLRPTTAL